MFTCSCFCSFAASLHLGGCLALSCLIAQYVVVYFRVLPYLNKTFGANSCLTWSFTYLGLPVGLVILDALMLLEPFGLLTVLPLPAWLKQFVPACALTGLRSHSSTSAFRSLIPPNCLSNRHQASPGFGRCAAAGDGASVGEEVEQNGCSHQV